jgi:hypothetical protein
VIVAALDALESLNRELLYLFVAGPGQGEGIAIALPGTGWLLVDGCTTGKNGKGRPLFEIVTRWRAADDDPITAMVLTHPHQDHAGGFAELVEDLMPRAIAVAGDLLDATKALKPGNITSNQRTTGAVLSAIRAIDRWHEDHPGKLVKLEQGALLSVEGSAATVTARAPNAAHLEQFLTDPGVTQRLRKEANHISLVLELEYGAARIVLTGDLPRYRLGTKAVVPSGWDQVLNVRPDLGDHLALKIPHHGSAAAMHPNLMPANGRSGRAWIVTPYNSSNLPRVAELDGLPRLLELQPSILLTCVPASKTLQAAQPSPGIVRLVQLASRYASQPLGEPFLDAASIELTPGDAYEPLDSVWALALDRAGTVVGKWRGRAALEVVP